MTAVARVWKLGIPDRGESRATLGRPGPGSAGSWFGWICGDPTLYRLQPHIRQGSARSTLGPSIQRCRKPNPAPIRGHSLQGIALYLRSASAELPAPWSNTRNE